MKWLKNLFGIACLDRESEYARKQPTIGEMQAGYLREHMPIGKEFDYLGIRFKVTLIDHSILWAELRADHVINVTERDGRTVSNVLKERRFSYEVARSIVEG